ncbi:helix-turn-helix transcriptional regulator [Paenibacillus sp. P26]|nr:helix-turn-helix transcriptional regulator [Paenibacillus sp. P26]
MDKVAAHLEEHYAEAALTLQQLAELAGVHPNYLTQTFRKITGLSCMQYLARLRMEKAKALLHQTDLKICDIAERVGYENPLYFSDYFKKWVGVNPSDYKDGMGSYA